MHKQIKISWHELELWRHRVIVVKWKKSKINLNLKSCESNAKHNCELMWMRNECRMNAKLHENLQMVGYLNASNTAQTTASQRKQQWHRNNKRLAVNWPLVVSCSLRCWWSVGCGCIPLPPTAVRNVRPNVGQKQKKNSSKKFLLSKSV